MWSLCMFAELCLFYFLWKQADFDHVLWRNSLACVAANYMCIIYGVFDAIYISNTWSSSRRAVNCIFSSFMYFALDSCVNACITSFAIYLFKIVPVSRNFLLLFYFVDLVIYLFLFTHDLPGNCTSLVLEIISASICRSISTLALFTTNLFLID